MLLSEDPKSVYLMRTLSSSIMAAAAMSRYARIASSKKSPTASMLASGLGSKVTGRIPQIAAKTISVTRQKHMISTFSSDRLVTPSSTAFSKQQRRHKAISSITPATNQPSKSKYDPSREEGEEEHDVNTVRRRTPTLEEARSLPLSFSEMDNATLLSMAALDITEARAEILKRHIMDVDSTTYELASETFQKIKEYNRQGLFAHTIPYKAGIGAATIGSVASIPLCFHLPTVEYFNEHYVTADVPEPKDLETWLEVGSWAWNWMEPPLGQISFMILCVQFARNRLDNIGLKPWGASVKQRRAQRLVQAFPQYNPRVLMLYSKSVSYYS